MRSLLLWVWLITLTSFQITVGAQDCPRVCNCEYAPLSGLPISSVLTKVQHSHPAEEKQPSYQQQNEYDKLRECRKHHRNIALYVEVPPQIVKPDVKVLDEKDEHEVHHQLGQERLEAATCVLQPEQPDNMLLFHSLSPSLQALTLLQGPGTPNITLDGSHFQLLLNLVVLEIHGYPHGKAALRVRSDAFRGLENLQYINLQHLHLLGNGNIGNRPAPISRAAFSKTIRENTEANDLMEAIHLVREREPEVVPYSVYKEQQERDGLSAFAGLQNLVFLRAYCCDIKQVSWEMFDGLQQLDYLSLEGNNLPFLSEFAFYGTPNLKRLTLSHNSLLQVQSIDLAGLLSLEILDLSYNNISHLSELTLPPLPKLIMADFHHNPIEVILPYTFEVMNETEQLFLGGNRAQLHVYPNSFTGLNGLHKLSLSGIHLRVLERDYLNGMPKLKELRLEGVIKELSYDAFVEVPKLLELIMKRCSISKISMDAFYGLYDLVYLDLSHNTIETLPPSLFDHQQSLKELYLHDNKLTTLPEGIFVNIPAKLIRLDKNPWHCTCAMHEWQPSQINKVKVKIIDKTECQARYDKGSMCKVHYMNRYTYEQSVSPRCMTPARFSGWGVFHLLRKHLRCYEKVQKYKNKLESVKVKSKNVMHSENQLNKTNIQPESKTITKYHANRISETHVTRAEPNYEINHNNTEQNIEVNSSPNHSNSEQVRELDNNTSPSPIRTPQPESSLPDDNVLNTFNDQGINNYLWTKKDKDKYKLLQKKEERTLKRYNTTTFIQRDNRMPSETKVLDTTKTKTNKKYETLQKWETKMNETMRRLNVVPGNSYHIP